MVPRDRNSDDAHGGAEGDKTFEEVTVPSLFRPDDYVEAPKTPGPPGPPVEQISSEVRLGGPIPRHDRDDSPLRSGDLYLRLEGRIYGPFRPDRLEILLESGTLTGLETASVDLRRWTPLAYHPRIVRGRIRDLGRVHEVLTELSSLPARKRGVSRAKELGPPPAAVLKRPKRRRREDRLRLDSASAERND
jgi:hypothetical protein